MKIGENFLKTLTEMEKGKENQRKDERNKKE